VTTKKTVTFSYKTKNTPLYKVPKGKKWDENDPDNPGKQVDNRRLLENMCKGMKALAGAATQLANLTKDNTRSAARARRNKMCPDDFCKDANDAYAKVEDYSRLNRAFMFQCDEYPFATTTQGGDTVNGQHICLSGWENGYQGWEIQRQGIDQDEDFVIKITGFDCKTLTPEFEISNITNNAITRRDDQNLPGRLMMFWMDGC
jgi:hypothetical protein